MSLTSGNRRLMEWVQANPLRGHPELHSDGGSWAVSSPQSTAPMAHFLGWNRSLGIWGFQHKITALALQSSTTQRDDLGEHDSVGSVKWQQENEPFWRRQEEKVIQDQWTKRVGLHSFMHFCGASNLVRVPHLQWILHQAKRNKQNVPWCGFSESEVMNQNQLKGNKICFGK